jgi:hypothetical protein
MNDGLQIQSSKLRGSLLKEVLDYNEKAEAFVY